jgi:hypothetical protein
MKRCGKIGFVLSTLLVASPLISALAARPAKINFASPRRQYQEMSKGAWHFQVEKELVDQDSQAADKAMTRLAANLDKLTSILPASARDLPSRLTYFILEGPKATGGGRNNGLEYFQRNAPDHHRQLDPRWKNAMVVYSAKNYCDITDLWAMKSLMHELAHAYQLEQWPEKKPDIMAAWRNAIDKGLYKNVKDVNGKNLPRAYALNNQLEYFAEISACYFVGINYEPYNRQGLKRYDPTGYALVQKLWQTSDQ